jgi:hypothetical protein
MTKDGFRRTFQRKELQVRGIPKGFQLQMADFEAGAWDGRMTVEEITLGAGLLDEEGRAYYDTGMGPRKQAGPAKEAGPSPAKKRKEAGGEKNPKSEQNRKKEKVNRQKEEAARKRRRGSPEGGSGGEELEEGIKGGEEPEEGKKGRQGTDGAPQKRRMGSPVGGSRGVEAEEGRKMKMKSVNELTSSKKVLRELVAVFPEGFKAGSAVENSKRGARNKKRLAVQVAGRGDKRGREGGEKSGAGDERKGSGKKAKTAEPKVGSETESAGVEEKTADDVELEDGLRASAPSQGLGVLPGETELEKSVQPGEEKALDDISGGASAAGEKEPGSPGAQKSGREGSKAGKMVVDLMGDTPRPASARRPAKRASPEPELTVTGRPKQRAAAEASQKIARNLEGDRGINEDGELVPQKQVTSALKQVTSAKAGPSGRAEGGALTLADGLESYINKDGERLSHRRGMSASTQMTSQVTIPPGRVAGGPLTLANAPPLPDALALVGGGGVTSAVPGSAQGLSASWQAGLRGTLGGTSNLLALASEGLVAAHQVTSASGPGAEAAPPGGVPQNTPLAEEMLKSARSAGGPSLAAHGARNPAIDLSNLPALRKGLEGGHMTSADGPKLTLPGRAHQGVALGTGVGAPVRLTARDGAAATTAPVVPPEGPVPADVGFSLLPTTLGGSSEGGSGGTGPEIGKRTRQNVRPDPSRYAPGQAALALGALPRSTRSQARGKGLAAQTAGARAPSTQAVGTPAASTPAGGTQAEGAQEPEKGPLPKKVAERLGAVHVGPKGSDETKRSEGKSVAHQSEPVVEARSSVAQAATPGISAQVASLPVANAPVVSTVGVNGPPRTILPVPSTRPDVSSAEEQRRSLTAMTAAQKSGFNLEFSGVLRVVTPPLGGSAALSKGDGGLTSKEQGQQGGTKETPTSREAGPQAGIGQGGPDPGLQSPPAQKGQKPRGRPKKQPQPEEASAAVGADVSMTPAGGSAPQPKSPPTQKARSSRTGKGPQQGRAAAADVSMTSAGAAQGPPAQGARSGGKGRGLQQKQAAGRSMSVVAVGGAENASGSRGGAGYRMSAVGTESNGGAARGKGPSKKGKVELPKTGHFWDVDSSDEEEEAVVEEDEEPPEEVGGAGCLPAWQGAV